MNRIIVVLLILIGAFELKAQDPQYTQFYANPLYLNPAFAGATSEGRISVNYRNQWPSLAANFITYSASYDQYIPAIRSGVGIFVNSDRIQIDGQGNLPPFSSTTVTGNYSYVAPLNDNLALQLGLSAGVINRAINFNHLIFYDEIGAGGNIGFDSPDRQLLLGQGNAARRTVLDFGTGALLYSRNLWLGLSLSHINQPNMSVLEVSGVTGEDPLFMKISLHGGYKIELTDQTRGVTNQNEMSITPAFIYKRQGSSQQLSMGAYFNAQPLLFGLWYRGLPIDAFTPEDTNTPGTQIADNTITNQDAISILVGVMTPQYSIGYSYDITVGSDLRGNTGGTHEISITYNLNTDLNRAGGRPKRSRFGRLYCPNPWKQYQKAR